MLLNLPFQELAIRWKLRNEKISTFRVFSECGEGSRSFRQRRPDRIRVPQRRPFLGSFSFSYFGGARTVNRSALLPIEWEREWVRDCRRTHIVKDKRPWSESRFPLFLWLLIRNCCAFQKVLLAILRAGRKATPTLFQEASKPAPVWRPRSSSRWINCSIRHFECAVLPREPYILNVPPSSFLVLFNLKAKLRWFQFFSIDLSGSLQVQFLLVSVWPRNIGRRKYATKRLASCFRWQLAVVSSWVLPS